MNELAGIEARLAAGILPTAEERTKLTMTDKELAARWMTGMEASAEAARQAEIKEWSDYFAGFCGSTSRALFADFVEHGTDEQHTLFDVVVQYYPKVVEALVLGVLEPRFGGSSAAFRADLRRQLQRGLEESRDMWTKKPAFWSQPPRFSDLPAGCRPWHQDGSVALTAGVNPVMCSGCGNAEGVAVVHNDAAAKVTVTGVEGPWNFDPSDGSVHFEPGARSVQAVLAYNRRAPSVRMLLEDVMRLPQVREIQDKRRNSKNRSKGYWTDGRQFVPFHRDE